MQMKENLFAMTMNCKGFTSKFVFQDRGLLKLKVACRIRGLEILIATTVPLVFYSMGVEILRNLSVCGWETV